MTHPRIALAGLGFELSPAPGCPPPELPSCWRPFLDPAKSHPVIVVLTIDSSGQTHLEPTADATWTCDTWRMGATRNGLTAIEIHNPVEKVWIPVANLESDFSSGLVAPRSRTPGLMSRYALNYPYDQIILLNRLAQFDAALVHAAAVEIDGLGFLLCGRSGAGKTTLARLMSRHAGARLLNDEKAILRLADGRPRLSSTPWHGEESEVNAGFPPLAAILHLRQAPENALTPIPPANALSRIVSGCAAPFYSRDRLERVLDSLAAIVERAPSYILDFTPDERPARLCADALLPSS